MRDNGYEPRWDISRAIGAPAEQWVKDIRSALEHGSIEVKRDRLAMKTGNLYVEYECLRMGQFRPSGIRTTKADAWVFVLVEDSFGLILKTDYLRGLCDSPGVKTREETDGSHPTRGYLLPLRWMVAPYKVQS